MSTPNAYLIQMSFTDPPYQLVVWAKTFEQAAAQARMQYPEYIIIKIDQVRYIPQLAPIPKAV